MNQGHLLRLQRIFREVFDDPSLVLTPELSPADYSMWDSVAMVQIVLATEQEFGVRLSMETVAGVKSVADLLRALPA
jgi:acyl carrier protein